MGRKSLQAWGWETNESLVRRSLQCLPVKSPQAASYAFHELNLRTRSNCSIFLLIYPQKVPGQDERLFYA